MKSLKIIISISALLFCTQSTYAWVDNTVQGFLARLNTSSGKPMEEMTPGEARQVLVSTQNSVPVDLSKVSISKKTLTVDGQSMALTIVKPSGNKKNLPVFMFFHGGGWVIGDVKTHERLVRDLVVASGAAAVSVEYSRSPEVHYPVAINQAYAATLWVAQHGKEIGVDGKHLAVVGNSVGGNMAAVVCLMAKAKGAPKIAFQVLLWPVTSDDFSTTSYNEFPSNYFLTRNMMKWFWDSYTTDSRLRDEITAAPLKATTEQLQGLPPAFILTDENDVLRDEGEAYASKLNDAGVPVTNVRYNGMIHDFGMLNPLQGATGTKSAMLQIGAELKQHLQ
jgi:acetyl esterase/lipase